MIEVKELYKSFGDKVAVNGITFTVEDEIYGLLGPNGSGKSTLMKMMTGILEPTQGQVLIEGFDAAMEPLKVKEIVGYVPETPVLYESLTPGELFDFVGKMMAVPREKLDSRVNSLVEAFEIGEYLDQFIGSLSFGTKQKVSLITALLHNPSVLVLDEAMNGLDPRSARVLREHLLESRRKGKSMVFSTHVLPLAEMICDRVGVIHKGKLVAEGTIEELRGKGSESEENLEDIFLKLTGSDAIVEALRE
ncbi:MAG: ABC transporter ATP-binding protein [Archaeoglobaceae archaeon]